MQAGWQGAWQGAWQGGSIIVNFDNKIHKMSAGFRVYRKQYNREGGKLLEGIKARTMAQIKIYGKQLSGKYRETDYILVAPLSARQKAMKMDEGVGVCVSLVWQ